MEDRRTNDCRPGLQVRRKEQPRRSSTVGIVAGTFIFIEGVDVPECDSMDVVFGTEIRRQRAGIFGVEDSGLGLSQSEDVIVQSWLSSVIAFRSEFFRKWVRLVL